MQVTRVEKKRKGLVTDRQEETKKGETQVLTAVARDERVRGGK